MDWNNYNTATSTYVRINWAIATVLSSTIMATAMLYIVTEWCLQSHLSTANMNDAARGLYLTRRFRRLTSPFRDAIHYGIEGVYAVRKVLTRPRNPGTADDGTTEAHQHRRSVRWTKSPVTRKSQNKLLGKEIPLDDVTPGRPRASSDAPLIESRDEIASPPSSTDAGAASHQCETGGSQSPRASNEDQIITEIESPSRLDVPDTRFNFARSPSERRLSV